MKHHEHLRLCLSQANIHRHSQDQTQKPEDQNQRICHHCSSPAIVCPNNRRLWDNVPRLKVQEAAHCCTEDMLPPHRRSVSGRTVMQGHGVLLLANSAFILPVPQGQLVLRRPLCQLGVGRAKTPEGVAGQVTRPGAQSRREDILSQLDSLGSGIRNAELIEGDTRMGLGPRGELLPLGQPSAAPVPSRNKEARDCEVKPRPNCTLLPLDAMEVERGLRQPHRSGAINMNKTENPESTAPETQESPPTRVLSLKTLLDSQLQDLHHRWLQHRCLLRGTMHILLEAVAPKIIPKATCLGQPLEASQGSRLRPSTIVEKGVQVDLVGGKLSLPLSAMCT